MRIISKFKIVITAVVLFLFSMAAAFADAVTGTPALSLPWGDMLVWVLPAIGTLLLGGILMIAQAVAPPIYGMLRTAQVEQLLQNAIAFGLNAVSGATRGKTLEMPVGNEVLREALAYALVHGGEWVRDFAGDPVELAMKIYARLDMPELAIRPDFRQIVDEAQLTVSRLPDGAVLPR